VGSTRCASSALTPTERARHGNRCEAEKTTRRRASLLGAGSTDMELKGAHVVVTGASRGIGEALARAFAGEEPASG
jgi:hypothetical protein